MSKYRASTAPVVVRGIDFFGRSPSPSARIAGASQAGSREKLRLQRRRREIIAAFKHCDSIFCGRVKAMRRLCSLALVSFLILFAGLGCSSEDKRQWHEAMREWRGDNIRFGTRNRDIP